MHAFVYVSVGEMRLESVTASVTLSLFSIFSLHLTLLVMHSCDHGCNPVNVMSDSSVDLALQAQVVWCGRMMCK